MGVSASAFVVGIVLLIVAGCATVEPTPTAAVIVTKPSTIAPTPVATPVPVPATPSDTQPEETLRSCATSDLAIAIVHTSAAAGTVGGWIQFTDTGTGPCRLHGWPTLVGVDDSGATTTAKQTDALLTFPLVDGVPTIDLEPGGNAFAAFAGSDTPAGSGGCPPSYRSLRVTPPGATDSVSLSALIPYCCRR